MKEKIMLKKLIAVCLICLMAIDISGCEAMRKKFRRKKKEPARAPRIYQTKMYEKKPTPELYKKHFSYWVTWQSELIRVLGENRKKDKRCIEEIIGNLKDMQAILVPEKAKELQVQIDRVAGVRDIIVREDLTKANKDVIRMTLERVDRSVKKDFTCDKVKAYFKKSFEDEPPQEI